MADVKISGLPASTVPLAGTEVLPIVQSGVTKQVSIANVTAGRPIFVSRLTSDDGIYGRWNIEQGITNNIQSATTGFGDWKTGTLQANAAGPNMTWDTAGNTTVGVGNLIVTGSVIPNAVPSSKWGIDFAPSTSAGSYVSIANTATYTLASGGGAVYVWDNGGNGVSQAYCYYGTVAIPWQSGVLFSANTAGLATKVNIYYSGGSYIIENLSGGTLNFFISTIRLRTAP